MKLFWRKLFVRTNWCHSALKYRGRQCVKMQKELKTEVFNSFWRETGQHVRLKKPLVKKITRGFRFYFRSLVLV